MCASSDQTGGWLPTCALEPLGPSAEGRSVPEALRLLGMQRTEHGKAGLGLRQAPAGGTAAAHCRSHTRSFTHACSGSHSHMCVWLFLFFVLFLLFILVLAALCSGSHPHCVSLHPVTLPSFLLAPTRPPHTTPHPALLHPTPLCRHHRHPGVLPSGCAAHTPDGPLGPQVRRAPHHTQVHGQV